MTNPIPEEMHRLFDGYDGGPEVSKDELDRLIASAPQEVRQRIAEREAELRHGWVYIENEGAVFRGPARGVPLEVWSPPDKAFTPYAQAGDPKPVDWGTIISEDEAQRLTL